MANGPDKILADELIKIIRDKLLEHQSDIEKFRRKVMTMWIPGVGLEFLNDAFSRASNVTELIKNRARYRQGASESAFEKIYADSVTVWYWTKKAKKDDDGNHQLNPDVKKAVRSMVELFVSALGKE